MGIGIELVVDARRVKEARREVDFLNKGLREMENTEDLAPGKEGLQETSAIIRKISEDIRRMKGLTVKGEQQGGLLKKEQFQEAATLSKRIGQNMAEYTKEISKARNELSKLLSEKTKLERTSPSDPHKWVAAQERLESMKGQENKLRTHYERLRRQDPKAQDLARSGTGYTETIGSYGDAPSAEGGGSMTGAVALARKAVGAVALVMGGASLVSVARNAWSGYHTLAEKESGLLLRGVRFNRGLSPWNFMQGESADTAMSLRRTTGAADPETLDRVQRFARLSSIDPGAATGIVGEYYHTTGADPQKQRQAIDALLYMGKQAKDGRSEQLLGLINTNLMIAARSQGGRALTTAQASTVMAQTSALYNAPGTMGFSSGLFQTMQNGLMPGGDPTSEILKWDIIGGFKGPLTPERMIDLQTRRNAGLNNPDNLRRALAGARRYSKTRAGQIMYMQMVLNSFGEQGGVDKAAAIIDNGERILSAKAPSADKIDGLIKQQTGLYEDSAAFDIGQRYAKDDLVSITAGESLDPVAKATQELKWKGKSLFSRKGAFLKESKYDPLILEKARKYGIKPLLLKSIVQEESGYNRFAVSSKGAKGLGQMMPKTGAQYGLKIEDDFLDPSKNLDASARYLADLQKEFGGDTSSMIMAYHAGSSNVKRGKIGPATKSYLAKVSQDLSVYSQDANWEDWKQPVAAQKSEGGGVTALLKRIADTLDVISNKSGISMAPGASGSLRAPLPVGDR